LGLLQWAPNLVSIMMEGAVGLAHLPVDAAPGQPLLSHQPPLADPNLIGWHQAD
jgi:hypothetical protein